MTAVTAGEPIGHLEWNRDDGLPETILPGAPTSSLGDPAPGGRRAPLDVRVLGDGSAQVSMLSATGIHAVRLGPARTVVAFQPTGRVLDIVVAADGTSVALEGRPSGLVAAHGISATGSTRWSIDNVIAADRKPRLLTDAGGAVFAAGAGALIRIGDGVATQVIGWEGGGEPLMDPAGNVGFVRYDAADGTRSFVLLDPRTGHEDVVVADSDAWGILTRPIGIDATGRVYGYSGGTLGRLARDGHADWRVSLDDLEADGHGRVHTHPGTDTPASAGRTDPSLTRNALRSPSVSSVTAAGEIVTAVVGPGGVYVVGLNVL